MLESIRKPIKTLSTGQMVVASVVVLIIGFLIIGSINGANAPEPTFAFGLQTQPFLVGQRVGERTLEFQRTAFSDPSVRPHGGLLQCYM